MTIVGQVEQGLDQVEASPCCYVLVVKVWLHLQNLCCGGMALLLGKAKHIRISENLLEERQLPVSVLPMSVEEVHGK